MVFWFSIQPFLKPAYRIEQGPVVGETDMSGSDHLAPLEIARTLFKAAPHLLTGAVKACETFQLLDGTNKAMKFAAAKPLLEGRVAAAHRQACAMLLVVQLNALLDRNEKRVSFQGFYRALAKADVVNAVISMAGQKDHAATNWYEHNCQEGIERFLTEYRKIDWHDLHGRLKHFRDFAVAHIFAETHKNSINFGESLSLVMSVLRMSQALEFFVHPRRFIDDHVMQDRSRMVEETWARVLKP